MNGNFVIGNNNDRTDNISDNYKLLVQNLLFGIVIVQDEVIVFANSKAGELIDCDPQELIGVSVYKNIHPSDAKRVQQYHLLKQLGRTVPRHYDIRIVGTNGDIHHLEIQSIEIMYNDRAALLINLNDVTERVLYAEALRKSEERYRILFENNPDIVFLIENETIVDANPSIYTAFGYKTDEVTGLHPWQISPEYQPNGQLSKDMARQLMEDAWSGTTQYFEWMYQKKDGTPAYCEVYLVSNDRCGSRCTQAIVRDISDRKRSEENRLNLEMNLEAQKRQFYRKTILSFTDGRLDVVDYDGVMQYLSTSVLVSNVDSKYTLAPVRDLLERYLLEQNMDRETMMAYLIGVGEAMTNAVVHAGSGYVFAGCDEKHLWIGVADEGPGIESLMIPEATLGRGFSTKSSMGFGFTLMMEVADRILLCTSQMGTVVILMKNLVKSEAWSIEETLGMYTEDPDSN